MKVVLNGNTRVVWDSPLLMNDEQKIYVLKAANEIKSVYARNEIFVKNCDIDDGYCVVMINIPRIDNIRVHVNLECCPVKGIYHHIVEKANALINKHLNS